MGTGWADQLLPSQRSASGTCPPVRAVACWEPTAVQLTAEVQLIPASRPEPGTGTGGGLGACTMTHRAPSHRSASGPPAVPPDPTAMQAAAAGHETPASRLAAPGLGAGSRAHRVPFHRSASAAETRPGGVELPTAMQAPADGHDTPDSSVPALCAGFGTACAAHRVPSHPRATPTR